MDICLYASHFGTSGATRGNFTEEIWSKAVVTQAVKLLNNKGFKNVYTGGLTSHEMTQHYNEPNLYDVCISNHFNSGSAMLLYNKSRSNPHFNKLKSNFAETLKHQGIKNAGAINRPDLSMLNYGNSELYLLEWANCNAAKELAWLQNTNQCASCLADIVRKTFLDGKGIGENKSSSEKVESKKPYPKNLIGMKYGSETINDAYLEKGWYVFNTSNKNPAYPTLLDAMKNQKAFDFTLNKGDEVEYTTVIRSNLFDYILYKGDNGKDRIVAIRNKKTGWVAGYVK